MRTIYTPSTITKELEDKLWNDALIVFDTCALLDFYFLTEEYQQIMSDILIAMKDRIWIPAHVKYEFEKNHKKGASNPINEKYSETKIQKNKFVEELKALIELWDKQYYHPFITKQSLQTIKDSLADVEPKIAQIKTIISMQYQDRKKEIQDLKEKDIVGNTINQFNSGEPLSFSEIKKIAEEGRVRYANHIPPGYKDSGTKSGIRQFGDLIIWKEIIRKARESEKDIILISNDQKSDWVITDESKNDSLAEKPNSNEIGNPCRELLAEFEEETGRNMWIYSTSSFITKLENIYKPSTPQLELQGKLGIVRDVIEQLVNERNIKRNARESSLLIRCDNCGELFEIDVDDFSFDWQVESSEERGMGIESEYVSYENCECPTCNQENDIELHVWEYPVGAFNYQDIDVSHGSIGKSVNLSHFIHFYDYDECIKCGERALLNDIGLCENCQDEFDRFVNSDD